MSTKIKRIRQKLKMYIQYGNRKKNKNNLRKTLLTNIKDNIQGYTKIFFLISINLSFIV